MAGRKRMAIVTGGLVGVALVLVGLYGAARVVYYEAYAQGATQALVSETFFEVTLLEALRGPESGPGVATTEKILQQHITLNWESIRLAGEAGGPRVQYDQLKDLVSRVVAGPARPAVNPGERQ